MKQVVLIANDDDRVVRADPEDMYPSSRLKSILSFKKTLSPLRVNISRDALRSMICSQRLGRVIVKGDASFEEVCGELDRDCVSIVPSELRLQSSESESLMKTADLFVDTILDWSLFNITCRNGFGYQYDWYGSVSHRYIRICPKSRMTIAERSFTRLLCQRYLMKAKPPNDLEEILQSPYFKEALDFFELFRYDTLKRCRNIDAMERMILDDENNLASDLRRNMMDIYSKLMDMTRIFGKKPLAGVEILNHSFLKRGWRVVSNDPLSGIKALAVPTMWNDKYSSAGIHLLMESI